MKFLKVYGRYLLYLIISIIITTFILTISYYYNLIDDNTYKFLKLITLLLSIFGCSFFLGKKNKKKGLLTGIKFSLFIIFILFVITSLFSKFQIRLILYYIMIISSSCLGSVFGVNKSIKEKS